MGVPRFRKAGTRYCRAAPPERVGRSRARGTGPYTIHPWLAAPRQQENETPPEGCLPCRGQSLLPGTMTAIQPALMRHRARLERRERACRYPAEGESGAGRRGLERTVPYRGSRLQQVLLNPSPRATGWRVVLPAGSAASRRCDDRHRLSRNPGTETSIDHRISDGLYDALLG